MRRARRPGQVGKALLFSLITAVSATPALIIAGYGGAPVWVILSLAIGAITAGVVIVSLPDHGIVGLRVAIDRWRNGRSFDLPDLGRMSPALYRLAIALKRATLTLSRQEKQLDAAIEQQHLAMQEIHHRVKNNLQVVASLLNLQASRIRQPEARAEFQSARDRVRALATLHRHLYAHGEVHTIDMREFLMELCSQLFTVMGEVIGQRLQLTIEAPELKMSSDQAVPLALIVTEAVSNAVKYAFPGGRTGHVAVILTSDGTTATLEVRDDGVGIPSGRSQTETGVRDGLGIQLIRGFSRQLHATLLVEEVQGTRYVVTMPLRAARFDSPRPWRAGTAGLALSTCASDGLRLANTEPTLHILVGMIDTAHTTPALLAAMPQWRRHLHSHPELSLRESDTAAFICRTLQDLGVPFTAGVGGHGVVATLQRGSSNRSVGLRADMDALPITETTGLSYASTTPGVMHACGHDGHTASLLGAAAMLAADTSWSGTIQLVFQPAEEGYGGARSMLADGLLDRFPMERLFGFHNWPGISAGTIAVHDGPVMAAASRLNLTLTGHAGHAALPHLARDPVLAAGHLLVALQSIVSRGIDPLDSAVLSICMMAAGTAPNVIPDEASLNGTFRTHRRDVRDRVEAAIHRIAAGVGRANAVTIAVDIQHGVSATINTPAEADIAAAAGTALGAPVRRDVPPSMAGEDFGWYLEQKPGAFAWIGNGDSAELHNSKYDFNDAILPVAASWLATTAKRALEA